MPICFLKKFMNIEFGNSIRRLSFLCCIMDMKIAWINPSGPSKILQVIAGFGNWSKKSLCLHAPAQKVGVCYVQVKTTKNLKKQGL